MSAALEFVAPGLAVSVQDGGRLGHRAIGVPVSGALDASLLAAANAMLGQAGDTAGLEILLAGPTLRALGGPLRLALAGELQGERVRDDGAPERLRPGQSFTLWPGETLRLGSASRGPAYLAIAGGVQTTPQLGSRSLYARAGLGGLQGHPIKAGDRLPVASLEGDPFSQRRAAQPWCTVPPDAWINEGGGAVLSVRVLPGPQDEHFTPDTLAGLADQRYTVSRASDRMGLRLEGPALRHSALGAEIVSDGVTPGAIQVPPDGAPIVLLADGQTSGGYPKIATVISADLPRLAHARPGTRLCLLPVEAATAAAARRSEQTRFAAWAATIQTWRPPGWIDEAALYGSNLVSGMVQAATASEPPFP